ncbi:MAG: flavodoxin [Lachnospiraceae bacterium]|nr:flavodoxin [Lachnospiraceae bacterium]
MKKLSFLAIAVFIIAMLTACSSSSKDLDTQKSNEKQSETSGKIAVVYFSGTGNTKVIAEMIAKETNADIFEIVPKQAYTDADLNYNDDNCRANKEQNDDAARPQISNDLSATTEYDVIYLGHPIWWGTVPRIIQTYLEKYDLSDATIHTFCTSGSSSIDKSLSDLKGWYPKLNIIDGKRLNGATESDIKDFCSR